MTTSSICGAALVLLLAAPGCVDDKDPGTTLMTTQSVPVSDGTSATNATNATNVTGATNTTKTTSDETGGMSETGAPDVTSDTLVTANEADTGVSETGDPTSSATDSETSATTDPLTVDYEGEIQPIWDDSCSCHTQGGGAGGLVLAAGSSYGNLVLVPAIGGAQLRVFPGLPDESYVWRKLNDTHLEAGGSGIAMPLGSFPLPADDLDLIEAWILANAPP